MAKVALLGTGLLGSGFVAKLLQQGHHVRIWNRSRHKLVPLLEQGAVAEEDPAAAVHGAERVHLVLADDDAVDGVVSALRPGLGAGVSILDHSTLLPSRVADRSRRLLQDGVRYLHAPVFMSPEHARQAAGLMLVAGPAAEVEAVRAALEPMTGKLWHCGERRDHAAFLKLAGNAVLLGMTAVMGDLLAMARQGGFTAEQLFALFDVFKPGAALPFLGLQVAKGGEGPPSFTLAMARKDVGLMQQAADPSPLVLLPALAAAMDRGLARGCGDRDFALFARPDRI